MFKFEILNLVGLGLFVIGGIAAAVAAWAYAGWRKSFSTAILSLFQCCLLAIAHVLMFFDWNWKLRSDGREFPWYRDGALGLVVFLNTWMACVVVRVGKRESFFALSASFGGGLALVLANYCVANVYWWGLGAGSVLYFIAYAIIGLTARNHTLYAMIAFLSTLILPIGLPIVQLLSWTITQALDDHPDNINSNIVYLVVSAVGILIAGVVCAVVQSLRAPFNYYTPAVQAKEAEEVEEAEEAEATASTQKSKSAIRGFPRVRTFSGPRYGMARRAVSTMA